MAKPEQHNNNLNINNETFLKAVFGEEWGLSHVTAFENDPSNIRKEFRAACWSGGYAKNRLARFSPAENQYFTISLFESDEDGTARRRKSLFDACFVIVADDVAEKIPVEQAKKLPVPSYKMLSSMGSEQWGWILTEAVDDADQVNNLLDGLVAKGLAPDGTDPGMKGVTRYVRLPEGCNTKAKRIDENGGTPFPCRLTEWEPDRTYTLDDLAAAFNIDIHAPRGEQNEIGIDPNQAYNGLQHPILEHVKIEGKGHDGFYRLSECPNGEMHSDGDVAGAAMQFLPDGRINFMCHHGHCNGDKSGNKITGPKAVKLLDKKFSGIEASYQNFQAKLLIEGKRNLAALLPIAAGTAEDIDNLLGLTPKPVNEDEGLNISDYFYISGKAGGYFDRKTQSVLSKDNLDSIFRRQHQGTRASPLASKVFDFAMDRDTQMAQGFAWMPTGRTPSLPTLISDGNRKLVNTWAGVSMQPKKGDVQPWLDLMAFVVPNPTERQHIIEWMAYQLQYIEEKCNWQIVHLGQKGTGKDAMYTPLVRILGQSAGDISAEEVQLGWGDYLAEKKILMFQEIYQPQNKGFANLIKTWAAGTASGRTKVNLKGGKILEQANVMGMVMMSNHKSGFALESGERRYFVVESFFAPKEPAYYAAYYNWLGSPANPTDASAYVYDYLLNVDLTNFDAGKMPYVTEAAIELTERSQADYVQEMIELDQIRAGVFGNDVFTTEQVIHLLKAKGYTRFGRNGLKDGLEEMGFHKCRGTIKKDGQVLQTPIFWSRRPSSTAREDYDYYIDSMDKLKLK